MKVKSESEVVQLCPTFSDLNGLQPTRLLRPWDFPGGVLKKEAISLRDPLLLLLLLSRFSRV